MITQEAEAKSAAASTEGDSVESSDPSAISGIAEHEATTAEMKNAQHSANSEEELDDEGASSS